MAYEMQLLDVSKKGAGVVGKYYFVELSTSVQDQVDECNAASDRAFGVSQESCSAIGNSLAVRVAGITKVVAGAAISLGAEVGTTAAGKAITKSASGDRVRGIALEAAGSDGDIITVLLTDYVKVGTTTIAGLVNVQLFTTAGGDATEVITIAGVLATDVCLVTVNTLGTGSRTVTAAACTTDTVTVTLSGDPSTNHILNVVVFRP
jgi:hypothetical protein